MDDKDAAMQVVAELFDIEKPLDFLGIRYVEKGKRNRPIEVSCEKEGEIYVAYVKRMRNPYDALRSLFGLEFMRLLNGEIKYIFGNEYQVTASAGSDLEDTPVHVFSYPHFAYALGKDEAMREFIALTDIRPANHCYNGKDVITIDLESCLKDFVPVKESHEKFQYSGLHTLDQENFYSGIADGRKLIAERISENLPAVARLIKVIEGTHMDELSMLNVRAQGPRKFSEHVFKLLAEWNV
jgi:hypothetical protein